MSPIRGLTDNLSPAFPRLGKLRKGGEKQQREKNGKAYEVYGKELDHFRFTADNPEIVKAFHAAYGEQPQELDIYLPFASIEDNFSTWKEAWSAGGLQHRCDGETCTIHLTEDGTYSRRPVPCPGSCQEVGRLSVILPPLFRASFVGYVTMETHSINDIAGIMAALLATKEARGTEDMRGIGFCLRRVEREISTPAGNGKRARRKKWMVELVPAVRWILAQLEAAQAEAMGGYLPAPEDEELADADWQEIEEKELGPEPRVEPELPLPGERAKPEAKPMRNPGARATAQEPPTSDKGRSTPAEKPAGFRAWSENAKRAFWATMRDLGFSHDAIHAAFGIESMNDCTLTLPQAGEIVRVLKYGLQECGLSLQGVYDALEVGAIHEWQNGEKAGKERIDTWIAYLQDREDEDEIEGAEGEAGDEQQLPF